jgi:isoquinoline 1-oxidoreductase
MKSKATTEALFEEERYELYSSPAYRFELARRDFFKLFGGGVFVLLMLKDATALQESGGGRRRGGAIPQDIASWLHIAEDGAVTVYSGKVEVGQDIRTSLTQAVAEELRVPTASIRFILGDTDLTPYDMGTFGSRTTPVMAAQLRRVSAAARELMLDLAAEQLKKDRKTLVLEDGKVLDPATKQALSFGQLTRGQKLLKAVTDSAQPTPADQ